MYLIDQVPLDWMSRGKILNSVLKYIGYTEMSKFDSAFLCGLLNMKRPKKILEVGVAGGGTTSIILQCMEDIGESYEMHSVDISKQLYRNGDVPTGNLAEYAKNILHPSNHKFHLGGTVVDFKDDIGDNVDFLILDTTHRLPGETLDFLILLPQLANGCIVCIHDIAACQYGSPRQENFWGNIALFSAVTGKKYWDSIPDGSESSSRRFPNIAAFEVNEETRRNIFDIFLCLFMPWRFFPKIEDCLKYVSCIHSMYEPSLCKVFDDAFKQNILNFGILNGKLVEKNPNMKILIYGAGRRGSILYRRLCELGISNIVGQWIDKNAASITNNFQITIEHPDKMMDASFFDFVIITIADAEAIRTICKYLKNNNFNDMQIIICQLWNMTQEEFSL